METTLRDGKRSEFTLKQLNIHYVLTDAAPLILSED